MLRRRDMAAGLLAGAMATGAARPALAGGTPKVGQPAPDFRVTTFDLQTYSRDDLRGQVVLLNYWATWCAPCRAEMLVMDTYLRRRRVKDLRIFAVTVESAVPDRKLKELSDVLAFPLAKRLKGSAYGAIRGAVPTSFVIDRAGVIRHAQAGAFSEQAFDALITPLLAEPAPPPLAPGATT